MGICGLILWVGSLAMVLGGQCCRKRKAKPWEAWTGTTRTGTGTATAKGMGPAPVPGAQSAGAVMWTPAEPRTQATQLSLGASEALGAVELDVGPVGEPSSQDTLLSTGLPPPKPKPTRPRPRFSKMGRQRVVPRDQGPSWGERPDRKWDAGTSRKHVLNTIGTRGGYIIDWAAQGMPYLWVRPNTPLLLDDNSADAEIPVTEGHSASAHSRSLQPRPEPEPDPGPRKQGPSAAVRVPGRVEGA